MVEFPVLSSSAIAFLTVETSPVIESSTGSEAVVTIVLPEAPDPVREGSSSTSPLSESIGWTCR